VVCDVCWQVVKERLLDMLNREEEEESHGENVVKKKKNNHLLSFK